MVAPVAVIVIVSVDAVVGVPLTTPVDDEMTRPAGKVPEVTAYDTAPVKLLDVNAVVAAIAEPVVPETVWVEGVITEPTMISKVCANPTPSQPC